MQTITVYRVDSTYRNVPDGITLTRPTSNLPVYWERHVILPDGYTVEDTASGPCVFNERGHACELCLGGNNYSLILAVSEDGSKSLRRAPDDSTGVPLLDARLNAGLTQQQLADASGVNIRQIQRVESGDSEAGNLAARNYLALTDALGLDAHALL